MPQGKFVRTLIAFLLLCFAPRISYGQSRTKMVFGYASMSSVVTTLWVAQEKGFFAKNGIDVQTVFIPGSPTLIASINTGDVQMAYTGGTATLGAAVGGLDMVRYGEVVPGKVATYYRDGKKIHSFKEGRWSIPLRAEFMKKAASMFRC